MLYCSRPVWSVVKWIGRSFKNIIAKNRQKAAMKQMVFREITPPKETAAVDLLSETEPTPVKEKKPSVKEKEPAAVPAPRVYVKSRKMSGENTDNPPALRKSTAGDYHPSIFWMTSRKKRPARLIIHCGPEKLKRL